MPSGERFEHHTVVLPPAAMTVVLDDAGEHVLLAWRHRFVPDVWNWELPGGLLDPDETPAETAAREVEEETGYRPRSVEHLVTFEPMIGMARTAHHVFLARGEERVGEATEVNEGRFEWIALAEVPELIAKGRIVNSGSLVGLLHVLALSGPGAPSRTQ
jgi:8-oxo-dGTP pyrophosphatase MutT (NUDIX family)